MTRNGLDIVVVSCPLETALKLMEEDKLQVGWSLARVEMLRRRSFQCFKYLALGHTCQMPGFCR